MKAPQLIQTINESMGIKLQERLTSQELKIQLAKHINKLIQVNFEKLLSLLYRIDVSEPKLKKLLQEHLGEDAGNIIATLIIERQEQKIKLREQSRPGTDIPETEKW
jgi:hypothetical protein